MKDCKTEVLRALEPALVTFLDGETASRVIEEVVKALAGYDVQKTCTELIVYDNVNEQLLKRYCACLMIDGKSEKTIYQYARTLSRFALVAKKLYTEISQYDIRLFLAKEKSKGLSNTTLENTRAHLSAFFQWMTLEDIIDKNPCAVIKPIKCPEKEKPAFSAVEIDQLRSACETSRERALIELLLSSGLRVSELTDLTLDDIDFSKQMIQVRNGKGGKSRTAYFDSVAKAHLEAYIKERKLDTHMLFYNKKRQPLRPGGVRCILNRIAERAGVSDVHPHRFRRTLATNLAERGMSVQDISRLLGHTSINTTMIYVSMTDEKVHTAYSKFMS